MTADAADGRTPRAIDWDALRSRLAVSGRKVDARAVLEARARELARPLTVDATVGDARELLVLRRGRSAYAVDVGQVLDVARTVGLTPLPGADAPVVALLPWRGRLIAVVDVAPSGPIGRVVVVRDAGVTIGLASDTVDDIRSVDAADMHPVAGEAFVRAVTGDAISLLDLAAITRRLAAPRHPSTHPTTP